MAKFCKLVPDQGVNLFKGLKEKFGYDTAWTITMLSTLPDFQEGKTFRLDSEGFPLMEDLLKDKTVKTIIGEQGIMKGLEKNFMEVEESRDNYEMLVHQANTFNSDTENKKYIALVEANDNKLKVKVSLRTVNNEKEAIDQYSVVTLNRQLATILSSIGITIEDLEAEERRAGRTGVTDFTKLMNIADSTVNVIRVANNYEGSRAVSEEFSHLVIGAYRDESLVKRSLNALSNEDVLKAVLGDEYQSVYDFQNGNMELIAEEALGKLLRDNLLAEVTNNPSNISLLLDRLYSNIKNKFKNIDYKAIQEAVVNANALMGQMAKDLLSGQMELRKEKVLKAGRDAQFNALSERIETNIDILKKLRDIEVKRLKISSSSDAEEIKSQKEKITDLTLLSEGEKDTRIGIYNYAKQAVAEMQEVMDGLTRKTVLGHPTFATLRRARSYVQSYAGFIKDMRNAIMEAAEDLEVPKFLTDIELEDGTIVGMRDIINELDNISNEVIAQYARNAQNMLIEFFKPFFGDEIVMSIGSRKGETVSIEDVIMEATKDISFLDMWLDSMSDSSDLFLQLFSSVVKKANDNARESSIADSHLVDRLLKFADEHNIKDFEWMFEKDSKGKKSGNYIDHLNYAVYNEARQKEIEYLEEKYGKNATGDNARNKRKEYKEWLKENANPDNNTLPKDIDKYVNKDYENLDKDRRFFYEEFLKLKIKADSEYPDNRTESLKAIQMRKSQGNRILESIGSPKTMISNIKENMKQTFLDAADDDQLFGAQKTGLMNFDNTEYMALPVIYTNRLKNPEELSTDVLATLLAYQFASNTYREMSIVVDPLEVARNWVIDKNRKVVNTRGDKPLQEKIQAGGQKIVNKIYKGDSNIERKLNEFMESNVYQRYMKDEGTILGTNVSVSKAGNWLLHVSSAAQLGFNWLANTANVATGLAMTNIEAAAGEFFNARELANADKTYWGLMSEFLPELGSRVKTNKLSLFDDLFNVRIDYDQKVKHNMRKNLMQKLFGENIAYLGQDGGDHWLYNRIAIAFCKHRKVLVPKQVKHVKKVRGFAEAENILRQIILNSQQMQLTEDEKFYENNQSNAKSARVTSVIQATGEGTTFETVHPDGRPNNWITPATNIGTGIDEFVRDFFEGLIVKGDDGKWHHDNLGDDLLTIYPNMTEEDMSSFLEQLDVLQTEFINKGLHVVSRDIVARGKVSVNVNGKLQDLNVAGTLDLLVYDDNGDFYIYDMKTHRGKINNQKRHKWSAQLSLYKKFLEEEYGINVKGLNVIPIKVSYPTPTGEVTEDTPGEAEYTVKEGTNQLYNNGEEFKGASPKLGSILSLSETQVVVDYNSLGESKQALQKRQSGDFTEMTLWDALQIVDVYDDRSDIKKMIIPDGTTELDGSHLSISKISREIQDLNIHLFGAYNPEDSNAANRVVLGKALQQYRKWIKPQFNKRFQGAQINVLTGKTVEGYYRTFGRYYANKYLAQFMNEALRGKVQMAEHWNELSDAEKSNIRRAWFEIIQCFCVYLIAMYAPWPDDKKRPWALKYAEYMAKREMHELGMLTPSLSMLSETLKTVQSPMPVLNSINNGINLVRSIIHPEDWIDEKQSGPYKGLSTLEANFLKAPIPGVTWYRQIEKFGSEIDNSINFYARPY